MKTRNYVDMILNLVDSSLGKSYKWSINDSGNEAVTVSAKIPTVVGSQNMTIYFDPQRVYAYIQAASEFQYDELSDSEILDILMKANNVNLFYNNAVVAFVTRVANGWDAYIRGNVVNPELNDIDSATNELDLNMFVTPVVVAITDFIRSVKGAEVGDTNDFLLEFMEAFDA